MDTNQARLQSYSHVSPGKTRYSSQHGVVTSNSPVNPEPKDGVPPTREELAALANRFDELGDSRGEIARSIDEPANIAELLRLLTEAEQHEAACVFAERALLRAQRGDGWRPDARWLAAIEAKRAWLRDEISDDELIAARDAAIVLDSHEPSEVRQMPVQSAAVAAALEQAEQAAAASAMMAASVSGICEIYTKLQKLVDEGVEATEATAKATATAAQAKGEQAERKWQVDWIMERAWGGERPAT